MPKAVTISTIKLLRIWQNKDKYLSTGFFQFCWAKKCTLQDITRQASTWNTNGKFFLLSQAQTISMSCLARLFNLRNLKLASPLCLQKNICTFVQFTFDDGSAKTCRRTTFSKERITGKPSTFRCFSREDLQCKAKRWEKFCATATRPIVRQI